MTTVSSERTRDGFTNYRSSKDAGLSFNDFNCVQFSGIAEFVKCGDAGDWEWNQPFSASAWIRTNYVVFGKGIVERIRISGPPFPRWQLLVKDTGYLSFSVQDDLGRYSIVDATSGKIDGGNWHHVCFAYDGSANANGISFYVDGASQSKTIPIDNTVSSIRTTDLPRIGMPNYWRGQIRHVSLWNSELSLAQVAQLRIGGLPSDLRELPFFADCDAWWPMGRLRFDQYPDLTDWSGNGRNAQMINMMAGDIVPIDTPLP